MPLGNTPEEWWITILRFLRFVAQTPVALLVVTAAIFGCFVLFMFLFRLTQWAWIHWLSLPW